MELQAPKGTKDLLPKDAYKWHYIENKFKKIAEEYGFKELRTPTFEYTDLFLRGVGETTDVVSKEMYTFLDKGGRSITLKAEGTAPSARAIIESSLYNEMQPTKLYYFTPVFRYENVQKGRLREHHQFGIEMFGSENPSADAEVISLAMRAFEEMGIKSLKLKINSIGHPECRADYNIKLKEFLKENYDSLCDTCKERYHKNPMRILDCKNKSCQLILTEAPLMLDNICSECSDHFEKMKSYLDSMEIDYEIDKRIVRGLDYYSKTVFEILDNDIAICGGGRYDYLMEEIGGPEMPAVGFGLGIERLLLTLEEDGIEIPKPRSIDIFIAALGEEAKVISMSLAEKLRRKGLKVDIDHMDKKLKGQMKYANRIDSVYTMILGSNEIKDNVCSLKNMDSGEQFEVKLDVEEIFKTVK